MGLGYTLWVASLRSADLGAAMTMAAEADGLLRRAGVPMGVAHNAEGRGIIAFERGDLGQAASFLTEAIEAFAFYGNVGCVAHGLEAAAVVIAAAGPKDDNSAAELLAAADELRRRSGQGHRPWEIRARLPNLDDRIGAPSASPVTAVDAKRRYTLSGASALATRVLRSVATQSLGDRTADSSIS